jgi:hypothetical protein
MRTFSFVSVFIVLATQGVLDAHDGEASHDEQSAEFFRKLVPAERSVSASKGRVTIRSRDMRLTPSRASGLPAGYRTGSFELTLIVGGKLTLDEHERRARQRLVASTKSSTSDLWLPDFYDDRLAYQVAFPIYLPVQSTDRQAAARCYSAVRDRLKVYPRSKHADPSYYSMLLTLGSN